jgi:hypothetical protein
MIPPFPRFKPLEPDDRACFEAITLQHPPYSDWVFMGLLTWNPPGGCAISLFNGNLVVRARDYCGEKERYSFFGTNQVVETAATLLAEIRRRGLEPELMLIPKVVIAAEDRWPGSLRVELDPANHDYVLSIEEWTELVGGCHRKHRHTIRALQRRGRLDVRLLDLWDADDQTAMLDLFARWVCQRPPTDGDERGNELAALRRLFSLGADDRLTACGLYDGDRLVGFSIWEGVPGGEYTVHHFRKTDRAYDGLSTYLRHEESRLLRAQGYRFANIEQDLGIERLRHYKRSLRPCRLQHKYRISAVR